MSKALASVVICAWNNWPDLEMAIESALNQSYQPLEVIVVDNASTDSTPEQVARRYGGRLLYLVQPNKDTAGAYNTGFDASSGEFIQFLDGDDVLAPDKIDRQAAVLAGDPGVDMVYGEICAFQSATGPACWTIPPTHKEADMLMAILTSALGICTDLGMLYRRSALVKVGPWDESLYVEDLDYLLRAAWSGCRFEYCPDGPTGFARVHRKSKTQNSRAMNLGNEAVWSKALGFITREPYRRLLREKLGRLRLAMALAPDQPDRLSATRMLDLARATAPWAMPAIAYAAAWAALTVPGGRAMARSPMLRSIRQALVAGSAR